MPLLSYSAITDYPFQPFTKIYSADINLMFSTIQTLLNTTGLDDTNVQIHGLTRNGSSSRIKAGTANYVVINDSNGDFAEEAQLATSRGGTGLNIVPGNQNPGDVIQVNSTSTGLTLAAPTAVPASVRIFTFNNFG